MKDKRFEIRLSEEDARVIRELAAKFGCNQSDAVRLAVHVVSQAAKAAQPQPANTEPAQV